MKSTLPLPFLCLRSWKMRVLRGSLSEHPLQETQMGVSEMKYRSLENQGLVDYYQLCDVKKALTL